MSVKRKFASKAGGCDDIDNEENSICGLCLEKMTEAHTRGGDCCNPMFINGDHLGNGLPVDTVEHDQVCCNAVIHARCILEWLKVDKYHRCPFCRQKLQAVMCTTDKFLHQLPELSAAQRDALLEEEEEEEEKGILPGGTEAEMYRRSGMLFQRALQRLRSSGISNDISPVDIRSLVVTMWHNESYFNSVIMQQVPLHDKIGLCIPLRPSPWVFVKEQTDDRGIRTTSCTSLRWCAAALRKFSDHLEAESFSFTIPLMAFTVMPALKTCLIITGDEDCGHTILLLVARLLVLKLNTVRHGLEDKGPLHAGSRFSPSQIAFLLALTLECACMAPPRLFCLTVEQTNRARATLGPLHYAMSRGISLMHNSIMSPPTEIAWLTCWLSNIDTAIPHESSYALVYRRPKEEEDKEEQSVLNGTETFFLEAAVPVNDAMAFAPDSHQPHLVQEIQHIGPSAMASCKGIILFYTLKEYIFIIPYTCMQTILRTT
jgi:hypothetical protein